MLERAERLVAEGLAAPVGPGGLDLRYKVVRRAIERQLPPAVEMTRRQSLVRALAKDERCIVALADQLLRSGHLLQDHQISQRDEAVASAIDQMLLELNYPTAAQLAERYLDAVSGPPTGSIALRAHLKAAMALNAVGNIGRGQSILTQLREQARAAGDHGVLADAILATGPLTTARRTHDDVLCDVENLLTQLPASEGVRRVQLACWAAHQLLLRGDRLRAEHLLDTADGEAYGGWQLQGLIQAVRAQADTLVGSEPEAARRSLSELRRWATSRSDLTAEAAACLLGAREAWADGTLEDVTEVRRDIAAVATRMPRPDLRWWPYAMDAAIELAAGRSRRARSAIDAAARVGRELKVEAAAPTAAGARAAAALRRWRTRIDVGIAGASGLPIRRSDLDCRGVRLGVRRGWRHGGSTQDRGAPRSGAESAGPCGSELAARGDVRQHDLLRGGRDRASREVSGGR